MLSVNKENRIEESAENARRRLYKAHCAFFKKRKVDEHRFNKAFEDTLREALQALVDEGKSEDFGERWFVSEGLLVTIRLVVRAANDWRICFLLGPVAVIAGVPPEGNA